MTPPALLQSRSGADNAATLGRELDWLARVITVGMQRYFGQACAHADVRELTPPELAGDPSPYAQTARELGLTFAARLVLILALAPHVRPQALDPFLTRNVHYDRGFTEFGGAPGEARGGFWPTLETALFLLAGDDLQQRFAAQSLFEPDHAFAARKILSLERSAPGHAFASQSLIVADEYLARFTLGGDYRPQFGNAFPARRIGTPLDWDDLILAPPVVEEIEEIRAWIEHRHTLLHDWHLAKMIKPGFRSLFYGPPGTGKTLTASLLGKACGLDVYRVDLSLVVSKYIGETEKNLSQIFDQAQVQDWILFFDEADALFGKRTQTSSANDRYANQEVSYLLQRVEDFPGVTLLATNLKGNIDEAFARRFQSMIYFPMPGPDERYRLWAGAFSSHSRLDDDVDLQRLAAEFEVAGGGIINVVRFASLMALRRGNNVIRLADIRHGIRREFHKDGKLL